MHKVGVFNQLLYSIINIHMCARAHTHAHVVDRQPPNKPVSF